MDNWARVRADVEGLQKRISADLIRLEALGADPDEVDQAIRDTYAWWYDQVIDFETDNSPYARR